MRLLDATIDKPKRHIDFPTYSLAEGDVNETGLIAVEIPNRDIPLHHPSWSGVTTVEHNGLDVVITVSAEALLEWRVHLNKRYPHLENEFSLNVE